MHTENLSSPESGHTWHRGGVGGHLHSKLNSINMGERRQKKAEVEFYPIDLDRFKELLADALSPVMVDMVGRLS